MNHKLTLRRRIAFSALLAILLAVMVEGSAAILLLLFLAPRSPQLIWNPNLDIVRSAWAKNGVLVDNELGWPPLDKATDFPRTASGAKFNSDYPESSPACIAAYGDSFVWGEEVPLNEGWIEELSRRIGCRVANYGVSGYGNDQAYLRFSRLRDDGAPLVLIGFDPENIRRNVNQYRGLMGWGLEPGVKGRYILDDANHLKWIAPPRLDTDAAVEMHRNPAAVLPLEYFLPDTRDGPIRVKFPYTIALARIALLPRVWAHLSGRPSYAEFYDTDHPSRALPLAIAIMDMFVSEAARRGKHTLIVVTPTVESFQNYTRFHNHEYSPFLDMLTAKGIDVFDPTSALISALNGHSYCELYVRPGLCQGHWGVAGGKIVAKVVATELKRRGYLK